MFLICPLLYLQEKKNDLIDIFLKKVEIIVLYMFSENRAGHRVTAVSELFYYSEIIITWYQWIHC